MSEQEIENFDYFYKSRKRLNVVKHGYKMKIQRSEGSYKIYDLLKVKLGTEYERIVDFIKFRGSRIKDIELLYCFGALSELDMFKTFTLEEGDAFRIAI